MAHLVVWCTDGQGYLHDFPECVAAPDGHILHIRLTENHSVVASYSLYNVIRWGLTEE